MPSDRHIWFLIADGAHARIVSEGKIAGAYATLWTADSADAHHRAHDLMSDRPGRTRESANSAHHAIEPKTDPSLGPKIAFCHIVAAQINAASAERKFDHLFVVAPPKIVALIEAALDLKASAMLEGELHKDLTKVPDGELGTHLDQIRARIRNGMQAAPR